MFVAEFVAEDNALALARRLAVAACLRLRCEFPRELVVAVLDALDDVEDDLTCEACHALCRICPCPACRGCGSLCEFCDDTCRKCERPVCLQQQASCAKNIPLHCHACERARRKRKRPAGRSHAA